MSICAVSSPLHSAAADDGADNTDDHEYDDGSDQQRCLPVDRRRGRRWRRLTEELLIFEGEVRLALTVAPDGPSLATEPAPGLVPA